VGCYKVGGLSCFHRGATQAMKHDKRPGHSDQQMSVEWFVCVSTHMHSEHASNPAMRAVDCRNSIWTGKCVGVPAGGWVGGCR